MPLSTRSLAFTPPGYISLSSVVDLGVTHSACVWVKPGGQIGDYNFAPLTGWPEESPNNQPSLIYISGSDDSSVGYNIASGSVYASVPSMTNVWHHLASVRNNTAVSLYLDGVLVGSGTLSTNADAGISLLGTRQLDDFWYRGLLDDFWFFTTALTGPQIAAIAAGTLDPATLSPVGGWIRADEGSGTTDADSSGNGNTAAFTGGVAWSIDVPSQLAASAVVSNPLFAFGGI